MPSHGVNTVVGLRAVLAIVLLASTVDAQQVELPAAPGKLFDMGGGRRLHAICTGQGAPTVVLEAGASSFAIDWTLVQREVAKTNRVCSYDRAGMGWSDAPPASDAPSSSQDLRALLRAAGEPPPYLLVGASRGGLLVRQYHADFANEVAGFVLVDPSSEDRLFTMIGGDAIAIAEVTAEQMRATNPSQPVAVPKRRPQTGAPFDRLPPDIYRVRVILDERLIASIPDTVPPQAIATGRESERALLARLLATRKAATHPLGDRPVVVLTRGDEVNADREAAHAALAALSTSSRHSVVKGAGHEIHLFAPGVVVQAIADVAQAIRDKRPLPRRSSPR